MLEIIIMFAALILGLIVVVKGGDIIVDVCSRIADVTGISDVLIGSTLVSFATTLPELTITILGMSQNSVGLVLGNCYGTILVNICLVLGVSLSFMQLRRVGKATLSKLLTMLGLVVFLTILAVFKILNVYFGILFVIIFFVYFIKTFVDIKSDIKNKENVEQKKEKRGSKKDVIILIIRFIVGALLIFAGGQLIVNSTNQITTTLNISATFIGVTVVAVGTSLPELVTSITSIKRKRLNLALGNVLGANIINLSLLFGLAMIMSLGEITISGKDMIVLIPMVVLATLVLCLPILFKKRTYKFQGIALLSIYAIYCIIIILII